MIMNSKQDTVAKIYFDRSGFGSKQTTLRDAREKHKTITMKDVAEIFLKECKAKEAVKRTELLYSTISIL